VLGFTEGDDVMSMVAVARFRLISWALLPRFLVENEKAIQQARKSRGFIKGKLLAEPTRAMWAISIWDSEDSMRNYYLTGNHRVAMAKIADYACEACAVHVELESAEIPTWSALHTMLLDSSARYSKVILSPTEDHIAQRIPAPHFALFSRSLNPAPS
jgi:heme-degrading monooxygenase HmoA